MDGTFIQPAKQEIVRTYATPTAAFSKSTTIPAGHEIVRFSGIVADPLTPAANGQPAVYGDTETQASSVFDKITSALSEQGLTEADVVAMTVYLVAPEGSRSMDFQGMSRAYAKRYGSPEQPNRPVRSTVQVAGLVVAGMLVEIEITAARRSR